MWKRALAEASTCTRHMDEQKTDEWLFEVESVFDLKSAGLIIFCSLEPSGVTLRVGEPLIFLCANGQEIETRLKSLPLIRHSRRHPQSWKLITLELPTTDETKQIAAGDQAFRRLENGSAREANSAS